MSSSKLNSVSFFYLLNHGTQKVGGCTTFLAHLLNRLKIAESTQVLTVTKTLERNARHFGFGIHRQNVPLEYLLYNAPNPFITCVDSELNSTIFSNMPKRRTPLCIIHDPAQLEKATKLPETNFRLITIRKSMQNYLKTLGLDSEFIPHPFYEYPKTNSKIKKGAIAMTRLDFRKNVQMMFDCNDIMPKNHENIIKVYGYKGNPAYVFHFLKLERMAKYWKGSPPLNFNTLNQIQAGAKFCVNLTKIKNDGGGTEYSLLESIYHDTAIILHKDWIKSGKELTGMSEFEDGYNCYAVDNKDDLAKILKYNPDTDTVVRNARKVLDDHTESKLIKRWEQCLTENILVS